MARRRRTKYTPRIAKRICEHIALGDTVSAALDKEPMGPSLATFWRWMYEHPEFEAMYEQARKVQAHMRIDRVAEMADEVLQKPKFAAAFKVASDIQCRLAEIGDPEKFGRKSEVIHKGKHLNPVEMRQEIKRLEKELGIIDGKVTDVTPPALPVPESDGE